MPFVIRDPLSWPITIPDASATSDGLLPAWLFIALKDLIPGPFVTWASLGFFDGFSSGFAPYGVTESRVVGTMVELSGLLVAPPAGTGGNFHVTNLPPSQRPSAARQLITAYQVSGGDVPTPLILNIDNSAGSITGVPGSVRAGELGAEIPAGGARIFLDGLSFLL